jgi:hypothetical protein
MEHRSHSNGWLTFLEHWWPLLAGIAVFLTTTTLDFFTGMGVVVWVWFFMASFGLMVAGASLIIRAKLPVYRSGRFFTFGVSSVPEHLAGLYRRGWRVFLFGVLLSLCLLLSKPS